MGLVQEPPSWRVCDAVFVGVQGLPQELVFRGPEEAQDCPYCCIGGRPKAPGSSVVGHVGQGLTSRASEAVEVGNARVNRLEQPDQVVMLAMDRLFRPKVSEHTV